MDDALSKIPGEGYLHWQVYLKTLVHMVDDEMSDDYHDGEVASRKDAILSYYDVELAPTQVAAAVYVDDVIVELEKCDEDNVE